MLVFKIYVRCCLDTTNEIMKNIFENDGSHEEESRLFFIFEFGRKI